ncbi:MAG: transglutaminase-like domain-containing protein [Chloroflexota bacterium]|nr:transglutaminase-like domain-containing protein [Chloroflexota bacterium]
MMRKIARNLPKQRWWDIWTALIALVAITLIGGRLEATQWASNLQILVYLSFFAGLAGLALGYSRFSPLIAMIFSTVYGTFLYAFLLGTTVKSDMNWRYRILNFLGWRLRITINQLIYGSDISDSILFLTIMAVTLWTLGSISAFILIRKGLYWISIVPLLITLLIIGHYDQDPGRNSRFLISFLFLFLLLIGRMAFLHYQQKWSQEGIQVTTRIQTDLSKVLVILVSCILFVAIIIPIETRKNRRYSSLWRSFTTQWERLTDPIVEIFTFEANTSITRNDFSSDSMVLGTGTPVSEEIVFIVQPESKEIEEYRNYWRARSYDHYEDGTWSTSPGTQRLRLFSDNFNIQYPRWKDVLMVKYTISTKADHTANIYAPGTPIWVSVPVHAITQPISISREDLIALLPEPELIAGDSYQVESNISLLTVANLYETSTDYPDWLDRYLQLPEDFSPEIKTLAEDIAEGLDSPYSIAFGITRYLRIFIEYSRIMPPAPTGVDPIEWFLFEEKMGFCNYFATAEVLMLRSLGIPARLSVGYAEGSYDFQTNAYTVREKNSHAWPEVYFVGYGWVTFEPTVSEPALFLPGVIPPIAESGEEIFQDDLPMLEPLLGNEEPDDVGPPVVSELEGQDPSEQTPSEKSARYSFWDVLAIGGILLLIILAVVMLPKYIKVNIGSLPILLENRLDEGGKDIPSWLRRWSFKAQLSPAERAYRQMGRSIRRLGKPLDLSETPVERAQTLIKLLPKARRQILQIVSAYQLDQYSLQDVEKEHTRKLIHFIPKEKQTKRESVSTYRLDQYSNQPTQAERSKLIVRRLRKLTRQAWFDKISLLIF